MKRVSLLVVLGLIGVLLPRLGRADDGIEIGILESLSPPEQKQLEANYGITGDAVIRMAFRKIENRWQAFENNADTPETLRTAARLFPQKLTWTVAFDGKARGSITGLTPEAWKFYADFGRQFPVPGQAIPRFGKPDERFASLPAEGNKVYRPLVLVSRPFAADPDGWKPARLAGKDLVKARAPFRAQVATESKDLRYIDDDIEVVSVYRSQGGRIAFALRINPALSHEDGPPDTEWTTHWFISDGLDNTEFLGRGLTLIDAGDYDGDGHSELIFMRSDENYDGYALWDPRQAGIVEFGWTYH